MEWLQYWPIAVALLGGWLWQNCVHELSHLIAVWYYEEKRPTGFYPYPHTHKGKFYFARFRCEPFELPGHPLVHAAPLLGGGYQLLFVQIASIPMVLLGPESFVPMLLYMRIALSVIPLVDIAWWFRSYRWGREGSDGQLFKLSVKSA
jgi:hypothetical protein